ncbi:MAG: hypothetical protein FIB08_12430 [Candidatus Methanoperedens sp.]|nr:hypothetical protein [Candidatus Methanoperedens sp.]
MRTGHFIFIILLVFAALSGCINQDDGKLEALEKEVHELKDQIRELEEQQVTPLPTPSRTESPDVAEATPSLIDTAPEPIEVITENITQNNITQNKTYKVLPSGSLFVASEMEYPTVWGDGKYELQSVRVKIINQQDKQLSLKAQIIADEKVLEEKRFTLEKAGSSYEFLNDRQHYINNTNVTLRLLIGDYEPVDYEVKKIDSFI